MIKWIIKRFLIGKVNDLLDQYKDDVTEVRETIQVWIARLEKVLACFKGLLVKLDDGKLDADEIDQAVAEIDLVVKEW